MKRKNILKKDLLDVASKMNIKKAENIITQIQEVFSNWGEYAKVYSADVKLAEAIKKTLVKI